jgi:uncharacterized phage-associated protein
MESQSLFSMNLSVITQAIYYLLKALGPSDKLKLVKLIYLADKIHLIKFNRTITEDQYWALRKGPAGSMVADVLGFNPIVLEEEEIEFIKGYFQPGSTLNQIVPGSGGSLDSLSKSDKVVLDFVLKTFGHMHQNPLVDLVHRFPEWAVHESFFSANPKGRKVINEVDLISASPNPADLPGIDEKRVMEARAMKTGLYF